MRDATSGMPGASCRVERTMLTSSGARLARFVLLTVACLVSTPRVSGQSDYYGISEDFGTPPAGRQRVNLLYS